jgi:hypothetical protein
MNAEFSSGNLFVNWQITPTNDGRILFQFLDPAITEYPLVFNILNRDQVLGKVQNYWNSPTAPPLNYNMIGPYANRLANASLGIINPVQTTASNLTYTTDTLFNALRTYNVFIHSSMNQLASQGPGTGDSDVIAVIPVTAPLGSLNVWQASGSDIDVFPIPSMMLNTISFYLTDDHGQNLGLQNGHVTLVFKIYDSP